MGEGIPQSGLHAELRGRRQRVLRGGRQSVTGGSQGGEAKYDSDSLHHFLFFPFCFPAGVISGCRILLFSPALSTPKSEFFIFLHFSVKNHERKIPGLLYAHAPETIFLILRHNYWLVTGGATC